MVAFTMGCTMGKALGQGHSPYKGPRRRQYGLDLVFKHLKYFFINVIGGQLIFEEEPYANKWPLSFEE
jgi:hypothetical protein